MRLGAETRLHLADSKNRLVVGLYSGRYEAEMVRRGRRENPTGLGEYAETALANLEIKLMERTKQ